jgi:hypothetical protein
MKPIELPVDMRSCFQAMPIPPVGGTDPGAGVSDQEPAHHERQRSEKRDCDANWMSAHLVPEHTIWRVVPP